MSYDDNYVGYTEGYKEGCEVTMQKVREGIENCELRREIKDYILKELGMDDEVRK